MYQESEDWTEHIRVLRILTEMFLPHISLGDLEQTFFSKVLPKTLQLYDKLMYELSSEAKGLTGQNAELCSTDSESVYCGHLHLISDLLQAVFKETYSLQKQLMELFDQISVGSASTAEDDITDMVSVIHTVLEICSVISNMDHALHANTWKFIIKQSLKHHSLLQCHLKHSDILSGLCKDTLLSFHSSLQLAEEMKMSDIQDGTDLRLFQKTVKLCRFFANSLVYYTKEYALLDAVLGSSMITSLLAMDSWCFLARYGTAELCAHHCMVVAHLVEFAHKFLPEEVENLAVWQHVSLRALTPDLGKRVVRELCTAALAQCRRWLNSRHAWGELKPVNVAFSVLLVACNFSGDALEAELQTSILGVLGQFWTFLQAKQVSDEPCLQQTLCLLLHLLEFFIQAIDAQLISQVFSLLSSLLRLDPPDHIRLAMLDFLSSVGKVFIPQEVQETVHEDVVPQCLNSEEIKNKVVNFMAK
ncbi:hypothetical protein CIB84_003618, partial [Bambusicola thoracicus]